MTDLSAILERVEKATARRRSIYETKRDAADAFADPTENAFDRYVFALEVVEVLEAEIIALIANTPEETSWAK